jgi:uncharacterized membrane protein YraQ (UPF0718 family)
MAAPETARRSIWTDKKFLLILLLSTAIALYFWTQSRYPSLDLKAQMGGDAPISGISFDTLIEVLPNSPLWWDLVANAINWTYTNWRGMTFGVLFAACALTLLGLIERREFNHPFANAALGAVIGAPLGVCVNCAAPIARGLHSGGMRLETTLAALVASPTLNVIVVGMSFALLPTYMAVLKLAAMLGFILIGIPLLTRFVFRREAAQPVRAEILEADDRRGWLVKTLERLRPEPEPWTPGLSWAGAVLWLLRTFGRNFLFIFAVTVPLMLLAGVLGAILVSLLPWDHILWYLSLGNDVPKILLIIGVIAMLAIILPVPMSFDVILAIILLAAGWPAMFVVPLLLGLGSFSIYSFLIIGRAMSWRVAGVLMASLAVIAALGGVVAWKYDNVVRKAAHKDNIALLAAAPPLARGIDRAPAPLALAALPPLAASMPSAPLALAASHDGAGSVNLSATPLLTPAAPGAKGAPAFTRLAGNDIGIDLPPAMSGIELLEPYTMFWGMAAGDVHGDGWDDVVIAREGSIGGAALFANRGGRFVRQELDLGPLNDRYVNAVALVDFNNDGRPDLFASSYMHGSYVFWNRGGTFDGEAPLRLPNGDAPMIGAPGFGDLDGDGDLDILAANWSVGTTGNNNRPFLLTSRDRVLWNEGGAFSAQLLEGMPGESLTSLIIDVNGDGRPDMMIGDDVSNSDKVYLNLGDRKFRLVTQSDKLIPWLTNTTMSFDAGDIDNDGLDELYAAQIAFKHKKEQWIVGDTYCGDPGTPEAERGRCFADLRARVAAYLSSDVNYSECGEVPEGEFRALCALRSAVRSAGYSSASAACNPIPASWSDFKAMCRVVHGPRVTDAEAKMQASGYVGGIRQRNVFLKRQTAAGGFTDRTGDFGVGQPGWSWNSKFVDLDQDGWLDLYVATGFMAHRSFMPNMFYHNQGGKAFGQDTEAFGLSDPVPTSSYLLLDYDRDGDMDVIRASLTTQPIVHRNDAPAGKALWVRLDDGRGNRSGVGAKVIVRTADGTRRSREIRQSGGFVSFDVPQAHFGLGTADRVEEVTVIWPDGSRTVVEGQIAASSQILVKRY